MSAVNTSEVTKEHPIAPYLRMDRIPHIWCPTCGIGTVVRCYAKALEDAGVDLDKAAIVSGIGCTGRVAGYMKLDAFHSTHGRALPFAEEGRLVADADLVRAEGQRICGLVPFHDGALPKEANLGAEDVLAEGQGVDQKDVAANALSDRSRPTARVGVGDAADDGGG